MSGSTEDGDGSTSGSRVALAYSGGLDTSIMIPWLKETTGAEVVAVVADVGQRDDFDAVRRKAVATGAVECRVVDLKRAFVESCAFPALRAGALYEGRYMLGTALARPVIAAAQVRVARELGCGVLAHGCTGKGNDQVRFELAYQALAPEMEVVAPWREWEIGSREEAIEYAREREIPVPATADRPYSVDQNLWHTSFEGGVLEEPAAEAPPDVFDLTVDPEEAPEEAETVEVGFEAGVPVALDGERLGPVEMVRTLNARAGRHGVGRVDLVENRVVGMKSRGVYETPAGTVLHAALRDLESLVLDHDTAEFHARVGARYGELVYRGQWHSPLREALDGFVRASHRRVTGRVKVKLFRGSCLPVARSSPWSLYREDLATFGEDAVYDQADAAGFISLWGIPTRVHAAVHDAAGGGPAARAPTGGQRTGKRAGPTASPALRPGPSPTAAGR